MPASPSSRAKYLQQVKELAETIAIVRGYPLQTVEDLTITRATEFSTGKPWVEAQKRETDLINAQFESVKAMLKTMVAGSNGIIKGLRHLTRK